ncbi:MAG TPA: KH domain-containing protein [Paenibacillus sp.]|uniref:KH domain-containing protein n=1 Tax=Paenibacillus sp. TaxID=58172 RepID=UPI0028D4F011|nr:KH domain-containing protein [Paenibacillus sp.]HUC91001.1 KH domain-containing protein [Paenibacillus sp.]
MKELILVIARALVDHPEDVRVDIREEARGTVYSLSVHPEDIGKVIGKQGRIAKALRTVVSAAGLKDRRRIIVDIVS